MSVQVFCFMLCSTLLTRRKNRLFYTTVVLKIQKISRFEPGPRPLFVAALLKQNTNNRFHRPIEIKENFGNFSNQTN